MSKGMMIYDSKGRGYDEDQIALLMQELEIRASVDSELNPEAGKTEPDEATVFALYDDTGGPKFIKIDDSDGCLALFDTEADAKRAVSQYPGTNYTRMSLCSEAQAEPDVSALVEALDHAATSLETISRAAGREDHGLDTMTEVRGYANSRARVAREDLDAYRKQGGDA